MRRLTRRYWWLGLLFITPVVALLALPQVNLAGIAAGKLSARLDRAVTVGALHVIPGWSWMLELRDATLANREGGSQPVMARLSRLSAVVAPLSLLRGPLVLHRIEAEGVSLLLERDVAGRRNWRFSGDPAGPAAPLAAEPPDRAGLPWLSQVRLTDGVIIVRTRSGKPLETRIDEWAMRAESPDAPFLVTARATYQGVPLGLNGELGTPRSLRAGREPVRMAFTITGQDTRLRFEGTSADPLGFDRMAGHLEMQASSPATLLALFGGGDAPAIGFDLAGPAAHVGESWRWTDARGQVDRAGLEAPLLELIGGVDGAVDRVAVDARLARLDLARFGGGGGSPSLALGRPDPEFRVGLAVGDLLAAGQRASDVHVAARLTEQWLALEEATATFHGANLTLRGRLEPSGGGGRILGDASLLHGTVEALRRAAGIGPVPLSGTLEAYAHIDAAGATLDRALEAGSIGLVASLSGGRIAREVVEAASIDLRALFRTAQGMVPLTCGLAVLSLRGGRGELAPLRLRAATGTIVGLGRIDLGRGTLDVVAGSERDTTSATALDVPIRISGSLRDPSVGVGTWPRTAPTALTGLPIQLRDQAERNACRR